jgi:hypothetical protein
MPAAKQQITPPTSAPEIPDLDLNLTPENLRRWLLNNSIRQHETLEETRKRMKEDGVSDKLAARCVYSEPTTWERHVKETLKLVTNSKTGKFHDISTLQSAGKLSDAEVESILAEHGGQSPPYYYISYIRRVVDNRVTPHKEWITANFLFEGLCVGKRAGHVNPEKNMKINIGGTIDYHNSVSLNWDTVKDEDGEEKRIATFNERASNTDDISTRIYEIPWSRQVFEAMMKHTKDGNVALGITDVKNNRHCGSNLDEFLTDDIIPLIERYSKPKPTNEYNFNLDPKDLADFMKFQNAKKEQGEDHFQ